MASLVSRRTPLGDLSNSMKAVASRIPHDTSKMKSISKAPGKWQTAGRKPLSDISNSRKPETKKQSFNAKKLPVLTEESDQTSAIAGEKESTAGITGGTLDPQMEGAAPLPPLWLTYCINVHVKRYFCQTSQMINYKKPGHFFVPTDQKLHLNSRVQLKSVAMYSQLLYPGKYCFILAVEKLSKTYLVAVRLLELLELYMLLSTALFSCPFSWL
uniref:Uncharacterized protein n=1 Tax=Salix viminalis TaxID=40686 RepID=A0A6N2MSQ5_SALVM